jgi:hypothetical protein
MINIYGIYLSLYKMFENVLRLRFTDSVQVQVLRLGIKGKS